MGQHELRCYNIDQQEPTGEARIDERVSLVVSFTIPDAAPIPLRGLIDTGSGSTFSAYKKLVLRTGTQCDLMVLISMQLMENHQDLWSGRTREIPTGRLRT